MLGSTAAVTGMIELLGATMLSGKYLARLLREDEKGLWPEVGQGRRGGIELRHLVNFWMAYALCGGRLVDGPRAAHEFGLLRMVYRQRERREPIIPPNANALLFPNSFLVTDSASEQVVEQAPSFLVNRLCDHLKAVARDAVAEKQKDLREWPVFRITLGSTLLSSAVPMFAEVFWDEIEGNNYVNVREFYQVDQKSLLELQMTSDQNQNRLYRTQVIIRQLECLAFMSLAVKAEDFDVHNASPSGPLGAVEGDTALDETKPAADCSRSGLQTGRPVTNPVIEPQTAPARAAQSDTKQGRNQRLPKPVGFRLQVRHALEPERTRRHGTHWSHYASP